jgi:DNA-binding transcriptional ArsR family regulator
MADRLELDDLGLIGEITHPLRSAVFRRLKEPRSVAEVAALLDVPVTRLYHHVKRLEGAGLIRVVATRRSGAATERRYQVTAKSIGLSPALLAEADDHEVAAVMGSLFDVAKLGFQREVELRGAPVAADDDEMALSLGTVCLSPGRYRELLNRLRSLHEEFESDADESDPESRLATLFIAAYPES